MASGFSELTAEKLKTDEGVRELNRMLQYLFLKTPADGEDRDITYGYGTPEGVIAKNIGALFMRLDGGASTTMYLKETGSSDTGWRAI